MGLGHIGVLLGTQRPRPGPACRATSAAMSTGPAEVAIPGNRVPASAATCRASPAAISALDGTHPVFTHVPPNVPRSIITTDLPRVVARIAAANAAPPDPMIARSTLCWPSDTSPVVGNPPDAGDTGPSSAGEGQVPANQRRSDADRGTRQGGRHDHQDPAVLRRPKDSCRRPIAPPPATATTPPRPFDRIDFIHRGQAAGLTLAQIRQVLDIRDQGQAPCDTRPRPARHPPRRSSTSRSSNSTSCAPPSPSSATQADQIEPDTCRVDQVCRYL